MPKPKKAANRPARPAHISPAATAVARLEVPVRTADSVIHGIPPSPPTGRDAAWEDRFIRRHLRVAVAATRTYASTLGGDVTDLAMTALLKAARRFDPTVGDTAKPEVERERMFVHVLAVQQCKDAYRRKKLNAAAASRLGDGAELVFPPASHVDEADVNNLMATLIDTLPPVCRRVIGGLYGLDHADPVNGAVLADRMGCDRRNVSRIHRQALRLMRWRLAATGVIDRDEVGRLNAAMPVGRPRTAHASRHVVTPHSLSPEVATIHDIESDRRVRVGRRPRRWWVAGAD